MSANRARNTLAVVAGLSAAAAVAAAVPSASGQSMVLRSYAPTCAPPGGIVNVAHDFDSLPNKSTLVSGGTKLLAEVWVGDDIKTIEPPTWIEPGRVQFSYREDPNLRGYWIPEFRQALPMPAERDAGGFPIVDYLTYIQPYGKDGTEYNNAGTHSTIYPDFGPRLQLSETKVKAGRGAIVTYMVRGFRTARVNAHLISGGKLVRHVKLRAPSGDDTCGRAHGRLRLHRVPPGKLTIVVNTKAASKTAAGGATGTIRMTR